MAKDLLLEIGCEEVPARLISPTLLQLSEKAGAALTASRLKYGEIKTFGTPRRLGLIVAKVSDHQAAGLEKRVGPFVNKAFDESGSPTPAGLGFARSCGVGIGELAREDTPKGEKLVYTKKIEGRPALEVLADLLPGLIKALDFPKAMRWGSGALAFVRPIHWITALFGSKVVAFELGGISSGKTSRGHRFTAPKAFAARSAADLLVKLGERGVIADPNMRREMIRDRVARAGLELGGEAVPDEGLADEVSNLVEYPVVLSGRFDPRFLALPAEVPISVMRTHQRYFAVRRPGTEKELLPCFVAVANTPARDPAVVARGNERVIAARLADAEFYWKEDIEAGIERMREGTAGMVFYKTLGSYEDKAVRVEKLARFLAERIFPGGAETAAAAARAARYCKADLVSLMVGEFAELQGLMGGEYARAGGLGADVADAIRDHYLPRSADDIASSRYPSTPAGEIVSLADKLDSVASCWAAGLAPTGAGDPYALRRQAQGVIALLLARSRRVDLRDAILHTAQLSAPLVGADAAQVAAEVVEFVKGRLRVQLLEQGVRYDAADACLAVWNGDLVDTARKIEAVGRMRDRGDFEALMVAFRRLMNIVEDSSGDTDTNLFQEESEAVLYSEYTRVQHRVQPALDRGDYDEALAVMAGLKPAVDKFFDEVMVNVEAPEVRRNRHALCDQVARVFKTVADFSKIVIEGDRG